MKNTDPYKTLGVSKTATQDEIKKAYKRLAKQYHPDRNAGDKKAENRFKEISEAYQVLSDPEKRKQVDAFGRTGFQGDPGFWSRSQHPGGSGTYTWSSNSGEGNFNFKDLFSQIFGGAGSKRHSADDFTRGTPFDAGAGPYDFHFGHDIGPETGRDVEAEMTISFDDAMRGGTHRLSLQRDRSCPACGGTGTNRAGRRSECTACAGKGRKQVANAGGDFTVVCSACNGEGRFYSEPCPTCGGSGREAGMDTLNVKIPAGVDNGGRLRVPGKGEMGSDGRAGDLYLRINVSPHRYFMREGKDLHLDLPVTVSEAALGATVEVPTLDGKASLKIPAATPSGARLRMKGKGAPDPKRGVKGDMYVHVQIVVPKTTNPKARKILEELKAVETDPRAGWF
jgi:molecular chaperone DnaJ